MKEILRMVHLQIVYIVHTTNPYVVISNMYDEVGNVYVVYVCVCWLVYLFVRLFATTVIGFLWLWYQNYGNYGSGVIPLKRNDVKKKKQLENEHKMKNSRIDVDIILFVLFIH